MTVLWAILVILPLIISLILLKNSRHRNPIFYFVIYQIIMSIGIFYIIDFSNDADYIHARILALSSVTILFFCIYRGMFAQDIVILRNDYFSRQFEPMRSGQKATIVIIFVFSTLISIYYYTVLVGYNLSALAISGGLEDSQESFTTLRLQAYAGQNYNVSGPINQFKNTLFPITLFCLFLMISKKDNFKSNILYKVIFYIAALPLYFYIVAGTGQRTFLFFTIAAFFVYFYNNKITLNLKLSLFIVAALSFMFSILSVFLGRSNESGIWAGISQLFDRIIRSNQLGSVMGMRLIANRDIPMGQEWMEFIVGLIPGQSGSILANEVHAYMFGSMRGTAPVNLWISTYYNFGYAGVPIVAIIILTLLLSLERFSLRVKKTIHNEMMFAFLFFYTAILPVGNPFQIINNGILAILLLAAMLMIGRKQRNYI